MEKRALTDVFDEAMATLRSANGVPAGVVISTPNRLAARLPGEQAATPPPTLAALTDGGATVADLTDIQRRIGVGDLAALAAADVPALYDTVANAPPTGPLDRDLSPDVSDAGTRQPFATPRKSGVRGNLFRDEASPTKTGGAARADHVEPGPNAPGPTLTLESLSALLDNVRKPTIPEPEAVTAKRKFSAAFDGLTPAEQELIRSAANGRASHDDQLFALKAVD